MSDPRPFEELEQRPIYLAGTKVFADSDFHSVDGEFAEDCYDLDGVVVLRDDEGVIRVNGWLWTFEIEEN